MKIKYLIDTLLSNDIKALDFVGRYGGMVSTIHTKQDDFEANGKGVTKRYPVACDVSSADCANLALYQDLMPNDEKISVVYWEELSPMANVGETATKNYYQRRFRGVARLVFWANLAKLGYSTCNGDMMAMQLEIERVVTRKGKVVGGLYNDSFVRIQVNKDVPQDINTVFGKYDYPNALNYYLYPFGFFAVDVEFEIDYCIATGANVPINPPVDCYNNNDLTDCEQILSMLTDELKLTCVLPTYDFSDVTTQEALSVQQNTDIIEYAIPIASCPQLTAGLNSIQLLSCILPTYDFNNVLTQSALSVQQVLDLKTWLLPQYDFADNVWQTLLTSQQKSDLTTYLLPLVDFTDVAIQALLTTQQKEDIISWLFPLLDFSDPSTQALVTPTQQTDLQNWLCTPAPPTLDYSFQMNGATQYIRGQAGGVYNLNYNNAFSVFTFCTIPSFATFTPLLTKIDNSTIGIFFALNSTGKIRILLINSILAAGRAIEVVSVNSVNLNVLQSIGFTYDGSGNASGVKLYLNGVNQSSTTLAATLNFPILTSANVEIGASSPNLLYSNYSVNNCRIWNIALSPADALIEGAGTGGKPNATPVSPANCIGDANFDASTFGLDTFAIPDDSGISTGFRSINMPVSTRFVQP